MAVSAAAKAIRAGRPVALTVRSNRDTERRIDAGFSTQWALTLTAQKRTTCRSSTSNKHNGGNQAPQSQERFEGGSSSGRPLFHSSSIVEWKSRSA